MYSTVYVIKICILLIIDNIFSVLFKHTELYYNKAGINSI